MSKGLINLDDTYTISFMAVATGDTTLSGDLFPDSYIYVDYTKEITTTPQKYFITGTIKNNSTPTELFLRF